MTRIVSVTFAVRSRLPSSSTLCLFPIVPSHLNVVLLHEKPCDSGIYFEAGGHVEGEQLMQVLGLCLKYFRYDRAWLETHRDTSKTFQESIEILVSRSTSCVLLLR